MKDKSDSFPNGITLYGKSRVSELSRDQLEDIVVRHVLCVGEQHQFSSSLYRSQIIRLEEENKTLKLCIETFNKMGAK